MFEHFKSYDYCKRCRETTSIAMREDHTPFVSHSLVAPFFWVWCGCCLFRSIDINFVFVTREPAVFSRSILRTFLI